MFFFKKNPAKSLGFHSDQEGIINRYLREQENWNIHLNNSQSFITDSLSLKKFESIAILGSGWLLDVPIEYIAQSFNNVYLIDIFHPQQVKHKCRHFKNIEFVKADITAGLIDKVFELIKIGKKPNLDQVVISQFSLPAPLDYVVSLNLLNQLDILLVDNLTKNFQFETSEIEHFRRRIQQSHFDLITKYNCSIIFDFKEIVLDSNDEIESESESIFIKLPHTIHEKTWKWHFDTKGYYYENKKVVFDVMAKTYLIQ